MSRNSEQISLQPEAKKSHKARNRLVAGVVVLALAGAGVAYGRSKAVYAEDNCTSLDHYQVDTPGSIGQIIARTLNGTPPFGPGSPPHNLNQLADTVNREYGYDKLPTITPGDLLTGQEILMEPENQKKAANKNSKYPVTADANFQEGSVLCLQLPVPDGLNAIDVQNVVNANVGRPGIMNDNALLLRVRESAQQAGIELNK